MITPSTHALAIVNWQPHRPTEAVRAGRWPIIAQAFQAVLMAFILGLSFFALAFKCPETWI